LEEIRAAAQRVPGLAVRTPLVRLNVDSPDVHLKLENLQPIEAFKILSFGTRSRWSVPL
jgi:threonine dehydratase